MQTCRGCKHLSSVGLLSLCREPVYFVLKHNPYSNKSGLVGQSKYGLGWLENTCEWMRAPGRPCGPDRVLYSPTLRARFLVWVKGKLRMGKAE